MVEKIDKALEVVFKIMKVLLILVLVSMIVILMAHIIFRYVLNNSLTWSEELLKIMLVWFGMMSVAVLAARREHVAIVVFKEHMPKKVQNFLTKLTQLIIVGICVFMVIIGIQYCMKAGFRLTPALRIPYAWAYAAIPVAFVPVTLFELRNFICDFTGKATMPASRSPKRISPAARTSSFDGKIITVGGALPLRFSILEDTAMYTLENKDGVCIYKDTMLGIELRLPETNCAGLVQTRQLAAIDEVSAIEKAFAEPVSGKTLHEIVRDKGAKTACVLISDATRGIPTGANGEGRGR